MQLDYKINRLITRTIWVSCLSHFLPRQSGISSRSSPCKAGILNFYSCTLTNFWFRDRLYPMTLPSVGLDQRRDSFVAKVPSRVLGTTRMLASGNTPSRQAGSSAGTAHRAVPKRSAIHFAGPVGVKQEHN